MAQPAEGPASWVYAEIVAGIRSKALTNGEIAQITGVSERQVYNWSKGASKPQGASRDRLLEVNYLVQELEDVYTPEGIDIWLHGRNRAFKGERPIELLYEGRFPEVLAEIDLLKGGH